MWFLRSLGCDPGHAGFGIHDDDYNEMGARYMWLLLAMHVAEDEGILVEVSQ